MYGGLKRGPQLKKPNYAALRSVSPLTLKKPRKMLQKKIFPSVYGFLWLDTIHVEPDL